MWEEKDCRQQMVIGGPQFTLEKGTIDQTAAKPIMAKWKAHLKKSKSV